MLSTNDLPNPSTLDPWHGAIVDAVCALDRARVEAGEPQFVRLTVEHELCPPDLPCLPLPPLMSVVAIAPGIRIRRPLDVPTWSAS